MGMAPLFMLTGTFGYCLDQLLVQPGWRRFEPQLHRRKTLILLYRWTRIFSTAMPALPPKHTYDMVMFDNGTISFILDYIYNDFDFRLIYRVTSKTNNEVFSSDERLVQRKDSLVATGQMKHHLSQAAQFACKSISPVEWTPDDPKCALQHCQYSGKTDIWIPRHPVRVEAWWQNGV